MIAQTIFKIHNFKFINERILIITTNQTHVWINSAINPGNTSHNKAYAKTSIDIGNNC